MDAKQTKVNVKLWHDGRHVHRRRQLSLIGFVLLSCALCLAGLTAPLVHASPFEDVPAGHWAYSALEQLSSAHLIDGYPPGFFSGARRLTRYEMALSLAGALGRLSDVEGTRKDSGLPLVEIIQHYNEANPQKALAAGDSELLRAGLIEFTPELEVLGHTVPPTVPWYSADRRWQLDPSINHVVRGLLHTDPRSGSSRAGPADGVIGGRSAGAGAGSSEELTGGAAPRLVGAWPGTPIARLGSTVLYVNMYDTAQPEMDTSSSRPVPALDGTIHLSERLAPNAGMPLGQTGDEERERFSVWQRTETWAGIGNFAVAPNVSLSGERARHASAEGEMRSTQVQAQVLLGDVSIDGKLRRVDPVFSQVFQEEDDDEGRESLGVGLTVRLGDVSVSAGRDVVHRSEAEPERVTSWTLEYGLADLASFKAGWQSVSDTRERTSVDVNVPVPQGALQLGVAYEGARDAEGAGISMTTLTMAGLNLRLREDTEARAAFSVLDSEVSRERTTSLGLRYSLSPEAALLLGYKLIDFAEDEDSRNVTTAEFSIRF